METKTASEGRKAISVAGPADGEIHVTSEKPSWSKTADDLRLDVWRQRYWKERKDGFGYRSIHFQIAANNNSLSAGHFVEWTGPAISYLDDFFYEADALSLADHDTADILIKVWGDDDSPFNYGSVVRFERLVIKSTRYSPEIWSLLSDLIAREFARRGSMLMLKAFPLEYEAGLGPGTPVRIRNRFRRRSMAMRRLYAHRLGISSVPGPYGKDGWMWRALRYCPQPSGWRESGNNVIGKVRLWSS
jgi:hypothetical protein